MVTKQKILEKRETCCIERKEQEKDVLVSRATCLPGKPMEH